MTNRTDERRRAVPKRALVAAAGIAVALSIQACGERSPAHRPPEPKQPRIEANVSDWSKRKKSEVIDGIKMAYYEVGQGDPIVFLHGNPTSSYLWRKIIPHVQHLGRCIAPDLVGMGDSQKLPNSGPGVYTYVAQRKYLFGLLDKLGVKKNVILVVHDWGSALGFHWAHTHQDALKGIAFMESVLAPLIQDGAGPSTGNGPGEWPEKPAGPGLFQIIRSQQGEKAILEENRFVEQFMFGEIGLYLTDDDKAEYRRPFLQPGEDRRPTLAWPREIPRGGYPAENDRVIKGYSAWLAESDVPKLFIHSVPGMLFAVPAALEFARSFPNEKIVDVYGGHYVQEVSPDAIGRALAQWIPTIE